MRQATLLALHGAATASAEPDAPPLHVSLETAISHLVTRSYLVYTGTHPELTHRPKLHFERTSCSTCTQTYIMKFIPRVQDEAGALANLHNEVHSTCAG